MTPLIRPAVPQDAPRIVALHAAAWREAGVPQVLTVTPSDRRS